MWKVNDTYILVTKWKLFVPKRKTTPGHPNLGNALFRKKKKKLVTKQSYSHTPDAVVVPLTLTRTYM